MAAAGLRRLWPGDGQPAPGEPDIPWWRKQADTALAAFVVSVTSGDAPVVSATTLGAYLQRWLDHITPTRSPTTVRGYRFKVKRISPELGPVQVDKLTPRQLDWTYREWLEEGLDPRVSTTCTGVLSAALRQAVKWGLLSSPPTARATTPTRYSRSMAKQPGIWPRRAAL